MLISSCSLSSEGPGRAEYWKAEVEFLNSEKISLAHVQSRYAEFNTVFDPAENVLTIIEAGESDSLVCSKWQYIISIKIGATSTVEKASLSETGTGL